MRLSRYGRSVSLRSGLLCRTLQQEFGPASRRQIVADERVFAAQELVDYCCIWSSRELPAHALGRIENIMVEPERRARVVVDQRSGTIVMGEDVRISRVAVSQGNLTLRIQEAPLVSQPNPFSPGETVVVPRTNAGSEQEPGIGLAEVPAGTSLSQVIAGLNALGVAPSDMIDILKSIKASGALHAEFIVQ